MKISIEANEKEVENILNRIFKKFDNVKRKGYKKGGRKTKLSLNQIEVIKRLTQDGISERKIAEKLGITKETVKYWKRHTPKELMME